MPRGMTPDQIARVLPRLEDFAAQVFAGPARADQRGKATPYLRGKRATRPRPGRCSRGRWRGARPVASPTGCTTAARPCLALDQLEQMAFHPAACNRPGQLVRLAEIRRRRTRLPRAQRRTRPGPLRRAQLHRLPPPRRPRPGPLHRAAPPARRGYPAHLRLVASGQNRSTTSSTRSTAGLDRLRRSGRPRSSAWCRQRRRAR